MCIRDRHKGEIWYDNDTPELRYSDGVTPGGIPLTGGTGGGGTPLVPATTSTLGGIKVGDNLTIGLDGTLHATRQINKVIDIPDIYTGGAGNPNLSNGSILVYNNIANRWDTTNDVVVVGMDGGQY